MASGIAISGRKQKNVVMVITLTVLAFACAGAFGLLSGRGEVASSSATRPLPSALVHGGLRSIDLGTIRRGGSAEARFRITNDSRAAMEIAEIQTSCPCLTVELAQRRIAPHETVDAVVRLNLADEPEFVGALSPGIRCFNAQGEQCCAFVVSLNVVPSWRRALQ